jgi:hypothetical protein
MSMQLPLEFTSRPRLSRPPLIPSATWLDVSEIACGVGFSNKVGISLALWDALEPIQSEEDGNYDQRLYDALWLAHLELCLDHRQAVTFTFTFPRKHWKTEDVTEISLRLRVETHENLARVGLLPDFPEATWRSISANANRVI